MAAQWFRCKVLQVTNPPKHVLTAHFGRDMCYCCTSTWVCGLSLSLFSRNIKCGCGRPAIAWKQVAPMRARAHHTTMLGAVTIFSCSVHFLPRKEEAHLEGRNTSFGLCGHNMEAGGANNGASTLSRGAHRFGVAWCHPPELKKEALQRDRNMEAGSGSDRDVAIPALVFENRLPSPQSGVQERPRHLASLRNPGVSPTMHL
ncbi:uncharacterized protein LOC144106672 isoform X2 [Amblyomma americanum]